MHELLELLQTLVTPGSSTCCVTVGRPGARSTAYIRLSSRGLVLLPSPHLHWSDGQTSKSRQAGRDQTSISLTGFQRFSRILSCPPPRFTRVREVYAYIQCKEVYMHTQASWWRIVLVGMSIRRSGLSGEGHPVIQYTLRGVQDHAAETLWHVCGTVPLLSQTGHRRRPESAGLHIDFNS